MKLRIKNFVLISFCCLLSCYFLFSALNGQYGLFNQYNYRAQETLLVDTFQEIKNKTSRLEKKVKRLSVEFLDTDLLDEQARKILGLSRPNEIILQSN